MKQILIIATTIALLFTACREEVKFNDKNISSKMVVNSFVEADSIIIVTIAGSKPIPGVPSNFNWINDANIVLFVNDKETETLKTRSILPENNDYDNYYYYEEDYAPNVEYYSSTKAEIGKSYRLKITHPKYGETTCETSIPKPVQIISVDTTYTGSARYNHDINMVNVAIKFKDPANEANYYRLIAYIKRGEYVEEYYNDLIVDSSVVVSEQYPRVNDPVINPEQEDANDFVFGSPGNPYNIFTDELIDGREYTVNFTISLNNHNRIEGVDLFEKGEFEHLMFILQSITPETYLFLKSSHLHHYYDGDLFAEPVQVFSNVENGLGIFGGQSNSVAIMQNGQYPKDSINYQYNNYYPYYYYN